MPFAGEDYFYVETGSVVDNVLAKNWDNLGINRDTANLIEGKYTKVSADIVNSAVTQLYDNVVSVSKIVVYFSICRFFDSYTSFAQTENWHHRRFESQAARTV